MNQGKNEHELAEDRNDPALEEELVKVRSTHPEWADEKGGDDAAGANPEERDRA